MQIYAGQPVRGDIFSIEFENSRGNGTPSIRITCCLLPLEGWARPLSWSGWSKQPPRHNYRAVYLSAAHAPGERLIQEILSALKKTGATIALFERMAIVPPRIFSKNIRKDGAAE